jgi:hypothetical protein
MLRALTRGQGAENRNQKHGGRLGDQIRGEGRSAGSRVGPSACRCVEANHHPGSAVGRSVGVAADHRRRFPLDLRRLPGPDVGGELILSWSAILGVEKLGRPFPLGDLVEPAGDEAPQESESAASAATNWPKNGLKPGLPGALTSSFGPRFRASFRPESRATPCRRPSRLPGRPYCRARAGCGRSRS